MTGRKSGAGCVALCLLLDQFPRNLFRDDARAFATDAKALAIARHAVDTGRDLEEDVSRDMRKFLYLPFEHSEDLDDQRTCMKLMGERLDPVGEDLDWAHASTSSSLNASAASRTATKRWDANPPPKNWSS